MRRNSPNLHVLVSISKKIVESPWCRGGSVGLVTQGSAIRSPAPATWKSCLTGWKFMDSHKIIKTHGWDDNVCLGVRNNSIGAWSNFLVWSCAVILVSPLLKNKTKKLHYTFNFKYRQRPCGTSVASDLIFENTTSQVLISTTSCDEICAVKNGWD